MLLFKIDLKKTIIFWKHILHTLMLCNIFEDKIVAFSLHATVQ